MLIVAKFSMILAQTAECKGRRWAQERFSVSGGGSGGQDEKPGTVIGATRWGATLPPPSLGFTDHSFWNNITTYMERYLLQITI